MLQRFTSITRNSKYLGGGVDSLVAVAVEEEKSVTTTRMYPIYCLLQYRQYESFLRNNTETFYITWSKVNHATKYCVGHGSV